MADVMQFEGLNTNAHSQILRRVGLWKQPRELWTNARRFPEYTYQLPDVGQDAHLPQDRGCYHVIVSALTESQNEEFTNHLAKSLCNLCYYADNVKLDRVHLEEFIEAVKAY